MTKNALCLGKTEDVLYQGGKVWGKNKLSSNTNPDATMILTHLTEFRPHQTDTSAARIARIY